MRRAPLLADNVILVMPKAQRAQHARPVCAHTCTDVCIEGCMDLTQAMPVGIADGPEAP